MKAQGINSGRWYKINGVSDDPEFLSCTRSAAGQTNTSFIRPNKLHNFQYEIGDEVVVIENFRGWKPVYGQDCIGLTGIITSVSFHNKNDPYFVKTPNGEGWSYSPKALLNDIDIQVGNPTLPLEPQVDVTTAPPPWENNTAAAPESAKKQPRCIN